MAMLAAGGAEREVPPVAGRSSEGFAKWAVRPILDRRTKTNKTVSFPFLPIRVGTAVGLGTSHERESMQIMEQESATGEYLRASEAAALLHVSPKTVSRWAKEGKIPHFVTLGGHRRFPKDAIMRIAAGLEDIRD